MVWKITYKMLAYSWTKWLAPLNAQQQERVLSVWFPLVPVTLWNINLGWFYQQNDKIRGERGRKPERVRKREKRERKGWNEREIRRQEYEKKDASLALEHCVCEGQSSNLSWWMMRLMASNSTAFLALECCTFLDLGGSCALFRIVSRHSVRRPRIAASSETISS